MDISLDCLSAVQKLHKEVMRNDVLKSTQVSSLLSGQSVRDVILNKRYIPRSVTVNRRGVYKSLDLQHVILQEFGESTEGGKLLLCGGPGMGKTTTVEQLIWDWASGIHLQHYTFILRLSSSTLRGPEQSLKSILLSTHTHISPEHLEIILRTPHTVLLVLDDLQNLLSNTSRSGNPMVCDPHQLAGGSFLVHSLLEGSLLPGVSVLLTSRQVLKLESVHCTQLMGFSCSQRKEFFQRFFKDKGEQLVRCCERAVGVKENCANPGFCWTLCCVCEERLELQTCVPETLSELFCMITHKLLQEYKVSIETAKVLIYGLGKLAGTCTSVTATHSDIIKSGLKPFLGSQILSAVLRVSADDVTSADAMFSFVSVTFKDFLRAVSLYLDCDGDDGRILEGPMQIHNYHFFLAGLSDPMQRKLLETSVGLFSSRRLSEFHRWLFSTVAEVLQSMNRFNHWHVLRILYHTLSPTLVRESVGLCKWRLVSYRGMQDADCVALEFVVRCLGELQELNLYGSSLTEEQAERIMSVFCLAKTMYFEQSTVSSGVVRHLSRALKDGRATDVNLSYCKLGDEAFNILASSISHSSVHTLGLRDCHLTPACVEALAEMLSTSKLCVLGLGGNDINDEGVIRLVGALGKSTCTLQNLSLTGCRLTGACLAALSTALTSSLSMLRILDLRRNNLAGDRLEHLSQVLQSGCCKLQSVSLDACELTGSCCQSLAAALQSEHCSLTELDLSVNELDKPNVLLLCDALKSPKCPLEKLSMNACQLTEPVFSALGSVLACGSSRLTELSIGVNRVGNEAVKHILKAMKDPQCQLQHLDIEMENMTDACVDELCEAVLACGSLTNLILSNNELTDASVPRLIELVRQRPALKLNVQYNDFSEDVFEVMDVYETIKY